MKKDLSVSTKNDKKQALYITNIVVALGIFISLLAVFTKYDLAFSINAYNPHTFFGYLFDFLGSILPCLISPFVIVAFIPYVRGKKHATAKYILLGFIYVYTVFMSVASVCNSLLLFIDSVVICVLLTVLTSLGVLLESYIAFKIGKKRQTDNDELFGKIMLVAIICVAVAMIGVDIIKLTFGRVRFYLIADNPEAVFRPWYVIKSHEFNSSFPSGHASRSGLILLLLLLPKLFPKLNSKAVYVLFNLFGLAFIALMMYARVIDGMHYCSDVLVGAFVSVFTYSICSYRMLCK